MRFLLDENVAVGVGRTLQELGHDVIRATDVVAAGSPDHVVATAALQDNRILVTHDRDFQRIDRLYAREAGGGRFHNLHRLLLSCPEPDAARRICAFLSVIEADLGSCPEHAQRSYINLDDRKARIFR
jgi:hypothetical protein